VRKTAEKRSFLLPDYPCPSDVTTGALQYAYIGKINITPRIKMTRKTTRVIIIAPPGRRRENLILLLRSFLGSIDVRGVDTFSEAIRQLKSYKPCLVLIDHSIRQEEVEDGMNKIRTMTPAVKIILLQTHPENNQHIPEGQPDGILVDGFSAAGLSEMIHQLTYS
jgi:two-component SAPR family response regulator